MSNKEKTRVNAAREQRRKKRRRQRAALYALIIICIAAVIGICVLLISHFSKNNSDTEKPGTALGSQNQSESQSETEPPFEEFDIHLMAVGDDLFHTGVINSGYQSDGTLNYDYLYDGVKDFLNVADIKVMNQETILGGDDKGYSSYPCFNSPTAVGDSLARVGFNVVLQASNHSNDMGLDGLLNCANFWEQKHPDVTMLGIHSDADKRDEIQTMEINGVTFALLNYTYNTNSDTYPSTVEPYLNMLCAYDENYAIDYNTINPQVIEDIKKADELADYVIVFPHWGTEYTLVETQQQDTFAELMTEAGADLIIGTHPHVIEPIKWVEASNGNKSLCYYSLGNYVSTQDRVERLLGGMAWVTFHVTEDGITIDEDNTGVVPLVNQYTSSLHIQGIYLLEDYTQDLANQHGIQSHGGVAVSLDYLNSISTDVFGDWVMTREEILNQ